jgi:hypothetical protein
MAGSITGANAVVMLSVTGLFLIPQPLQGFAADDVYDNDPIDSVETMMGVDGVLSAGFVYVPIEQRYALQANSPSVSFFDQWWSAMQQVQDVYFAQGQIRLPSLGKKWNMVNGVLVSYKPLPDGKKLLQPQRFGIRWERVIPVNAP